MGPLLLKSFEKLFDGPIKVLQPSFALEQSPVSWNDIITFARSNPSEFMLGDSGPGLKSCRFWIKGGELEISEDDYRLIMSGAPERMIPTQPIAEDESAELATLNILEGRLAMLIKKADAVASKARQLNYHLKGRRTAVLSRKATEKSAAEPTERPPPSATFPAIASRAPTPASGETAKIQQQLLEQFLSVAPTTSSRRTSIAHSRAKTISRVTNSIEPTTTNTNLAPHSPAAIPPTANFHAFSASPLPPDHNDRRLSHPNTASSSEDGAESQYRVLMATKIDKLAKGDLIYPPCDRCRRLKFDCTKHLTACSACTKKHAKCAWKDVREGEVEYLAGLGMGIGNAGGGGGAGLRQSGGSENGGFANEHLDPGLRTQLPTAMGMGAVDEERAYREREERFNHGLRLSAEQSMLTQIASAAAAAGNR